MWLISNNPFWKWLQVTTNLRQAAIDEKLDSYITNMIENFIVYSNKEEYLGKFSSDWLDMAKRLGITGPAFSPVKFQNFRFLARPVPIV